MSIGSRRRAGGFHAAWDRLETLVRRALPASVLAASICPAPFERRSCPPCKRDRRAFVHRILARDVTRDHCSSRHVVGPAGAEQHEYRRNGRSWAAAVLLSGHDEGGTDERPQR